MATPAYDMHKNLKDTDTKNTQEKWDLYEVLNRNIKAFIELTTFLDTIDEKLKKMPSQQISSAAAALTGSGGSGGAATATAKIDTKSSDEEYKKIYQYDKLPCFGALETHLNMAFYQSQEEGTPLRFDSIRNKVMTAVEALKVKADTMLSQYKYLSSKEGALIVKALEKLSEETTSIKKFLEVQIPDAEPIVPGGHTATAVKMG